MSTEESTDSYQWITYAFSLLLLFAVAVAFELLPLESYIEALRRVVSASGAAGPIVFVFFFALSIVVPPISNRPFVLLSGILFGLIPGIILTITGATLGALANYSIARHIGRRYVMARPRLQQKLANAQGLGKWYVIVVTRMLAGFTFDWYSYLLGLLDVDWRTFVLATILGITPGVIVEVYSGSLLLRNAWYSVLIGIAVATVSVIAYRLIPQLRRVLRAKSIVQESESTPPDG